MAVTLAEVAERAGVSASTVSRVLNDRAGVADATRDSVRLALEYLGYQAPPALRRTTGGVVGVVVPELANPVFPRYAEVLERHLANSRFAQMLCTQHVGGVHEDELVRRLLDRGATGIIFVNGIHAVSGTPPDRYLALADAGIPMVFVNGFLPDVPAPFLANDDALGVELTVQHVISLGHRSIGLAVGPRRYTNVQRRIDAFHKTVQNNLGVDPDEGLVEATVFSVEGGEIAATALLDRGVTAILCGSDLMALGAVRAARRRGLRVPEDVSVVGSDDSTLLEHTDPPLTTLHQPVEAIGAAAVQCLLGVMAGEAPIRAEMLFRPLLVVRGSTAVAPTG